MIPDSWLYSHFGHQVNSGKGTCLLTRDDVAIQLSVTRRRQSAAASIGYFILSLLQFTFLWLRPLLARGCQSPSYLLSHPYLNGTGEVPQSSDQQENLYLLHPICVS